MFQYALGRHLAHLNGGILKLDITEFQNYRLHAYGLNHFNISAGIATRNEVRKFYALRRHPVFRFIASVALPPVGRSAFVREESKTFDGRILEMRGNIYLDGYWQNEMYFKDLRDPLCAELTVKTPPDADNRRMAEVIKDGPSASLHVRLGDYLSDPDTRQIHGLLPTAYYETAIARVLDFDPEVRFFLFSDNPPEALKRIPLPASRIETVAINDATRNFEDLRLMTLTNHHIIANSSFSWWGAWLSRNDGITIAPKQWFADKSLEGAEIVPNRWTVV